MFVVQKKFYKIKIPVKWKALEGTITELDQHMEDTLEQEGEHTSFKARDWAAQPPQKKRPLYWKQEGTTSGEVPQLAIGQLQRKHCTNKSWDQVPEH